jgi:hypothetical protein
MERRGINLSVVVDNKGGATVIHYIPVVYDESLHALLAAR